jgi:hypothetical protein
MMMGTFLLITLSQASGPLFWGGQPATPGVSNASNASPSGPRQLKQAAGILREHGTT